MKKFLALFLALAMMLGCVGLASAEELPTITIMFHGSNVSDDTAVLEAVNEYIKDKVGAKLEVIWGTWGDFDQKATDALLMADETIDMVFTCSWSANEYNTFAKNGYFVKLDDLIAEYGAELVKAIHERGHEIGNHSDKHDHMTQLSADAIRKDLDSIS
ncbi:MAG: extracellular solute-binding protein, partial [Clostridia bacterium]|nr:extracellular solute-binding protein [Clostridia bacterium]